MKQGTALGTVIWLHGYSHREVAEQLQISRAHLTNIVNGVDPLQPETAESLGKLLGVVPGRLLKLETEARRRLKRERQRRQSRRKKR